MRFGEVENTNPHSWLVRFHQAIILQITPGPGTHIGLEFSMFCFPILFQVSLNGTLPFSSIFRMNAVAGIEESKVVGCKKVQLLWKVVTLFFF
jgi:hypothetical protein